MRTKKPKTTTYHDADKCNKKVEILLNALEYIAQSTKFPPSIPAHELLCEVLNERLFDITTATKALKEFRK